MKSLRLATIAFMIFVGFAAVQAADGKTEATSQLTLKKLGYMTARKFQYPRGTNDVKANDPSEKMGVAGAKFAVGNLPIEVGNLPVEESKSENTASRININKDDDTNFETSSNYDDTDPSVSHTDRTGPHTVRTGTHHDNYKRPGGLPFTKGN